MRLGFAPALAIAPATGPAFPFVAAGSMAFSFVGDIIESIGAGRKEADVIVPEQEKLGRYLGTIDQWLQQPLAVSQLQQIHQGLLDYWSQYKQWLYSDFFTADGDTRASDQSIGAGMTDGPHMEWQVNARLRAIEAALSRLGVRVQPPTGYQGAGSAINQLTFASPGSSYFPQAGTLPPVNTLQQPGYYAQQPQQAVMSPLLVAGLAAAAGLLLFQRSSK